MSTLVELSIMCVSLLIVCGTGYTLISRMYKMHEHERAMWKDERKDLLDRIQAPSFAEYTNKVVREKKAEQPEEKEDPVEFVS